MRNVEYIEFSDTDEALALLVASLGITYSFETELLPSYGNLTSLSESTSGYLGNSRSTNISNKLIIHSSTKIVLNNIEAAKFAIAEQIKNDYSPFAEIIRTHWNTNSAKTIEAYKKHSIDIIE